ncbi:hypothetical protein BT63DRAFT_262581 [Microthyrium microscopicum]|uniref:Uncharacterized protein n=1 Tax=Microthyrium microscopicum TaxID=703497 RepID=A0A6A6UB67_9PEZI|nr:hypothetical protein BT63DRAFT_262581 [Microthyrium microscopicum]
MEQFVFWSITFIFWVLMQYIWAETRESVVEKSSLWWWGIKASLFFGIWVDIMLFNRQMVSQIE